MTASNWIAFGGLMFAVISGGISALVWLLIRIGNLEKSLTNRLVRVETMMEVAFPEARERAAILDSQARVKAKAGARRSFFERQGRE